MMTNTRVRVALLAAVILGVASFLPRVAGAILDGADANTPREIHLVARDMTFYVEGERSPNPTLRARAGERVRLVFRNSDPGMSHDFTIPSWQINTRLLKGKGEDSIEFTVPAVRGPQPYSCTPHSEMMRGTIVVD
jgi:plastocyanin